MILIDNSLLRYKRPRINFSQFCEVKVFKFQWQIQKLNQELRFLVGPGLYSTSPQSKRNIVINVIEVPATVYSNGVNDPRALDLHLMQNLILKIPISTRHCIILIGMIASKSPYEWINHTIVIQNNPIIQTNKTWKTRYIRKY